MIPEIKSAIMNSLIRSSEERLSWFDCKVKGLCACCCISVNLLILYNMGEIVMLNIFLHNVIGCSMWGKKHLSSSSRTTSTSSMHNTHVPQLLPGTCALVSWTYSHLFQPSHDQQIVKNSIVLSLSCPKLVQSNRSVNRPFRLVHFVFPIQIM